MQSHRTNLRPVRCNMHKLFLEESISNFVSESRIGRLGVWDKRESLKIYVQF
jgi:hypothetical protein